MVLGMFSGIVPRLIAIGLVSLVAMPAGNSALVPAFGNSSICPVVTQEPDIGSGCWGEDGLFISIDELGREVGRTHGGDELFASHSHDDPPSEYPLARPPQCVGMNSVSPRIIVIYARAHDDRDRHAELESTVRDLVWGANGFVREAGLEAGKRADLRVECDGPRVYIHNAELPTDRDLANFYTIRNDLQNLGFNSPLYKYWVFYDDRGACKCTGMANIYKDDALSPLNMNNGNPVAAPMFAVNFGYYSIPVMLHELLHTMGGVQDSAPHTTEATHCTDGRDIMCRRDQGRLGQLYTHKACHQVVLDCNKDDYFNLQPEPGSYLANNWNIGSTYNLYIQVGAMPPI